MKNTLPICLLASPLASILVKTDAAERTILIEGSPLRGGVNGMFFDAENRLHVAQVYGRTISTLDADTGEILERLTYQEPDDLVAFPDDLTFGPDGTMYYTDPAYFKTVFARPPGGPSMPLLPIGSVPFANPVTLSTDGTRLFYAQCWDIENENSVFELNLATNESKAILTGIYGCASNAADYKDRALYTPRPFEGRIVRLDLSTSPPSVTNATTNMISPNAVKFNSRGELYATDTATSEVYRIDLDSATLDTDENRKLVASFPGSLLDNLAFDKDDRLFVSSTSDAAIFEVNLDGGEHRTVSAPGMSIPMGLTFVEKRNQMLSLHPGALYSIDLISSELSVITKSAVSLGPMAEPTSLAAWDDKLVLMSATTGSLMIWNLAEGRPDVTSYFGLPVDAHPFRGDLLVTESAKGRVVRASMADSFQHREVIVESPDAAFLFLVGDDEDVYVSDGARGLVLHIISKGDVIDPPTEIARGLSAPEGIAVHPNGQELLVVEGGKGALISIDLISRSMRTIETNLGLLPGLPGMPFGYPNDIVVLRNGSIYVNADGDNAIYKIQEHSSSGGISLNTLLPVSTLLFLGLFV